MRKSLTLLGATVVVASGWMMAGAQQTTGTAPNGAQTKPAGVSSAEEQGVRAAFAGFLQAYSKGDAAAMAAQFTEDGVLIDSELNVIKGREAIARNYADIFAETDGKPVPATAQIDAISFLTPDVARVEGTFKLQPEEEGSAGYEGTFRALGVRQGGKWLIAEVRDDPVPVAVPESNEVYLKELEWMVGDWIDESAESKTASTVKWAENKNFLVRTYSISISGEPTVTGTQFIGYDPLSGSIKSWVFDSEGSHGEGYWTRSGDNQWVIRATGVLRDGTTNSATQVVTQMNRDSVKLNSIDRIVGGELIPDAPEVVMVRKPPQPSAAPAPGR